MEGTMMKRLHVSVMVLVFLFSGVSGFAQVGINATLSGTVSDSTGALIPGVEVTAKNTDTGVVSSAITNESGTYRFPSLQPGSYEANAALPGFQPQTFRLTLGTAQQIRQNFTLQVGGVAQAVDVTAAPDQLLTAASASVGNVLPSAQLVDLPLVGRNVMDLVTASMPGVRGDGNPDTTFAGITANSSANVAISMDGVTMNTGRHTQGLKPASFINPDMVEEMQVVVAPVDVEGRGAAQIQMRTRSGTNRFRGAVTWNIRNSALDANSWSNNRLDINPIWYNRHQSTASLGGPVVRNKTFFFALFDRQDMAQKENVDAAVLTPLARQGIFRFFPGVNNGNADVTPSGSGNTRVVPVVDRAGNPLEWTQISGVKESAAQPRLIQKPYFRLGRLDQVGEDGLRNDSSGDHLEIHIHWKQHGGCIGGGMGFTDKLKAPIKRGRLIDVSNRHRKFLIVPLRTDDQHLVVENLGIDLQIRRQKSDEVLRRFPLL